MNTASEILNKSYDGANPNSTFSASASCPVAVSGTEYISTTLNSATVSYLPNALEYMEDDASGNRNGLCESNEICLYQPNYGVYFGEESSGISGSCSFTNGTVSGVTMKALNTNGN